jgi:creatinine amidohydrolase
MDKYNDIFDRPDDHAGEFETSVALALFPELVEYEKAKNGVPKPFRFEALQKGWVKTSRRFSRLNDYCASGDPAGATAEKGKKYVDLVVSRIGDFLVELATAPIDKSFPQVL